MTPSRDNASTLLPPDGLTVEVPLTVMGLATVYAAALSLLERRFPLKPDHIWAEVAGGVLISLLPVALRARKNPQLDWRSYEGAIWRSFFASGTPIILWQIGEAMLRHMELIRYTATREQHIDTHPYADDTTTLAVRSGERTRGGDRGC
jgi:hypothetical protein